MAHGLRDCAQALVPIANQLTDRYRVAIMELRGHGASERSDAYAMPNFVLDLYHVVTTLTDGPCALFGHSLGGHIASRFAATFPDLTKAVILVEGLGPPQPSQDLDEATEIVRFRRALLTRLQPRGETRRPLAGLDEAADRLRRNNPRLDQVEALRLVPYMTECRDDGLYWSFDSRANSVFVGFAYAETRKFWRHVQAPTCIVSGAFAHEHWGSEMRDSGFTGQFAEGELEARVAEFPRAEHHWFDHSGHMVHYDEPERLGRLCRAFLEQHYE
jgi:pimeloyl-ACP methyl ester carboxylesterase